MVRLYRTFSNLIYTVGTRCVEYLYTVSEWFNHSEPPRTFSNHFSAEKARCVEVFDVSSEWFDSTEPSRTSSTQWEQGVKDFYTPCFLCTEVVREGSRRFAVVEPLTVKQCTGTLHTLFPLCRLGNRVPYTTCSHCEDEVRQGSVQSNHSELTSKTSTHLAFSALKWFEKVRGCSRGLNHSETVYRYPTHLVTTV